MAITASTHGATMQLLGEGMAQLAPELLCQGSRTTRSKHDTSKYYLILLLVVAPVLDLPLAVYDVSSLYL